jgi:hypothetical protein
MKSHVASLVALSALVLSVSVMAQDTITKKPQGGPPPLGIHWAKGVKLASPRGKSPLMLWHHGPILDRLCRSGNLR